MQARVEAISEGEFTYEGPINLGLDGTMGASAHIVQNGVHVVLVTKREQPFGIAFSLTMGLDPRQMKYIGVKSAAHFRAGFEAFAGGIYLVTEPSVHSIVNGSDKFHNVGRKLYPLDDI